METKFKIVETDDYVLAVSDEEVKEGDLYYVKVISGNSIHKYLEDDHFKSEPVISLSNLNAKKIIAYQPKGNAPELDLPLFPEIVVEDEVDKLFIEKSNIPYFPSDLKETCNWWFNEGYKSATEVYSEEDLRKAYFNTDEKWDFESFKQSLKQPKPKWFIAETEYDCCNRYQNCIGCDATAEMINLRLKTTTIEGKVYLVGTYLYE